jgi:hypothetical protein
MKTLRLALVAAAGFGLAGLLGCQPDNQVDAGIAPLGYTGDPAKRQVIPRSQSSLEYTKHYKPDPTAALRKPNDGSPPNERRWRSSVGHDAVVPSDTEKSQQRRVPEHSARVTGWSTRGPQRHQSDPPANPPLRHRVAPAE